MKILNHDIASLVRRLRRFKLESIKCVSSNTSEMGIYDVQRIVTYLESAKSFKAWMVAQPLLDLPETSPMEVELAEIAEVQNVENDDLAVIVNMLDLTERELLNSQSARKSTGMISHDSLRFDSYIVKIENFLSDYVAANSPLDLPESSPSVPVSGAGNTGI